MSPKRSVKARIAVIAVAIAMGGPLAVLSSAGSSHAARADTWTRPGHAALADTWTGPAHAPLDTWT